MLIPLILQRGYSLDKCTWVEWFTRRLEEYTLVVSIEENTAEGYTNAQVMIELKALGVTCIRGVFAFADSTSPKAIHSFNMNKTELVDLIFQWINAAWDVEFVQKAAPLFDHSRQMGVKYIPPDEMEDIENHYFEAMQRLTIQKQILDNENNAKFVDPEGYSVFSKYLSEVDVEGGLGNG